MLIEVHYGDDCTLLVNGNSRGIHVLDFIRRHCHLSSTIPIDLCSIHSGEPLHLSAYNSKLLSFEREEVGTHIRCILTRIDDQGTYIPLLNNPKLITSDFLARLKRATNSKYATKLSFKTTKPATNNSPKQQPVKRRRSLKSIAIAATLMRRSQLQ